MAMGTRKMRERQEDLWYGGELPIAPGHPFYKRLNEVLDNAKFDPFCETNCASFYHNKLGRPPASRSIFPRDDDQLFRGTRQRARHRVAPRRFAHSATVLVHRTRREDAGSRHDLTHPPID